MTRGPGNHRGRWRGLWLALLLGLAACQHAPPRMPLATDPIEIRSLAPGVWLHTSHYRYPDGARYPSNGLIVQSGEALLLVDTAWGEAQTVALLERIEAHIGLPVRTAVITHAHYDRLAGADVLRHAGVTVLASAMTRNLARRDGLPVPAASLAGLGVARVPVPLANVEVLWLGPAHAPDNLAVWLPEHRILFGGCAIRGRAATSIGPTHDADLPSWTRALAFLQTRFSEALLVVPGHGIEGGVDLIEHSIRLLDAATPLESRP